MQRRLWGGGWRRARCEMWRAMGGHTGGRRGALQGHKENHIGPFLQGAIGVVHAVGVGNPVVFAHIVAPAFGHEPETKREDAQFPSQQLCQSPPCRSAAEAVLVRDENRMLGYTHHFLHYWFWVFDMV